MGTLYRWITWHLSTQHLPSHIILIIIFLVKMLWLCKSSSDTETCMSIIFFKMKEKKKAARVESSMHLNPNRTQPVLSPTCQIHQATQKFHRYEERQDVPAVFWSRWSLTVSEDHCVCLPVSDSAPDLRRKTTWLKKKLHFHLTQETRLPIPKWPKTKTDGFRKDTKQLSNCVVHPVFMKVFLYPVIETLTLSLKHLLFTK